MVEIKKVKIKTVISPNKEGLIRKLKRSLKQLILIIMILTFLYFINIIKKTILCKKYPNYCLRQILKSSIKCDLKRFLNKNKDYFTVIKIEMFKRLTVQ